MTFYKAVQLLLALVLVAAEVFAQPKVDIAAVAGRDKVVIAFDTTDTNANKTNAGAASVLGNMPPATVLIVPNNPPVANAGDDIVMIADGSQEVTLNGEASTDEDGEIVSYVWKIEEEEIAKGAQPTVILDKGTTSITLTVTDDEGATSTDEVKVTINEPANIAPIANAGENQILTVAKKTDSVTVSLDGSASTDEDGEIDNYSWYIDGKEIATGKKADIALGVGAYTIFLKVKDNKGLTSSDHVLITIKAPANQKPIADAGKDQLVVDENGDGFEEVQLDGSNSQDEDGNISEYEWRWELATAEDQQPLVKLAQGKHAIILTVTDENGLTASDTVVVTVKSVLPVNQVPVADAGEHQALTDEDGDGKEEIVLDGSASEDTDGTIVSYVWYDSLHKEIANGASVKLTLDTGRWNIYLKVTDDRGASAIDSTTVVINPLVFEPLSIVQEDTPVSNISTHPNPSEGLFTITSATGVRFEYYVTDTRGKVLMSQQATGKETILDMSSYASGIYYLIIQTDHGRQVCRIMVL